MLGNVRNSVSGESGFLLLDSVELIFFCGVVLARRGARQTVAPAIKLAEHVDLDVLAVIVRIALFILVMKK